MKLQSDLSDNVRVGIVQPLIEGDLASVSLVNGDKKVPSEGNAILETNVSKLTCFTSMKNGRDNFHASIVIIICFRHSSRFRERLSQSKTTFNVIFLNHCQC